MSHQTINQPSIHAHEILHLLIAQPDGLTTSTLNKVVEETWGSNARFHTCRHQNLSWIELFNFLLTAGKVIQQGDVITCSCHKGCQH